MELFIISFTASFLSILCIYIYLRISTKRKILKDEDPEWHKAHYKMWDWLSKHPDDWKEQWLQRHPEYRILAGDQDCFACAQARIDMDRKNALGIRCLYCPFKTKIRNMNLGDIYNIDKLCLDGLWWQWKKSNGRKRIRVAKKIRDFPLYKIKD